MTLIPPDRQSRWVALALLLLTFAFFSPVLRYDFVGLDDASNVFGNPYIANGFTGYGIRWALTADLFHDTPNAAYWQPLTFFSRMLDTQLFGLNPAGHHAMNLFYHLVNVLLVFLLFRNATGAVARSAAVAFLFALHPLAVETVAWVTARRDLLSALFALLTVFYYTQAVRRGGNPHGGVLLFLFTLSLLAKPVFFFLPLALILWDRWPLRRTVLRVREKAPLFAAALAFLAIGLLSRADVIRDVPGLSSAGSGVAAYVYHYGLKSLFPVRLTIYGPPPFPAPPLWQSLSALAVLAGVTLMVLRQVKKRPYLLCGWGWYLLMLFFMVMAPWPADRYVYLPRLGLCLMAVWAGGEFLEARPGFRPAFTAVCGVLAVLLLSSFTKTLPQWRNPETVALRQLEFTSGNFTAHNNLGAYYMQQGRLEEAAQHFRQALEMRGNFPHPYINLAMIFSRRHQSQEAIEYFRKGLALDDSEPNFHVNLAKELAIIGDRPSARHEFEEALRLSPGFFEAHYQLGELLTDEGEYDEALRHYQEALRFRPLYPEAENSIGSVFYLQRNPEEAIAHFRKALEINPRYPQPENNLGLVYGSMGRYEEAMIHFRRAMESDAGFVDPYFNAGIVAARTGNYEEAVKMLTRALELKPDYEKARQALEKVKARQSSTVGQTTASAAGPS